MSTNSRELQRKDPSPPPKQTERGSIHAEIEQIRRIVNGANKRLERLSNELKK